MVSKEHFRHMPTVTYDEIDQKVLAFLAREAVKYNPLLAQHLYQIFGISIRLSKLLERARRVRRLDTSRETRSLDLYHTIIFLSREGLSATEVYILPYCQDGECPAETQVMAARMRATFFHNICLYHNHPPVSQLKRGVRTVEQAETMHAKGLNEHAIRKARLRDAVPSITSESSYITNPYASDRVSPLPSYSVPPFPVLPSGSVPAVPPGLEDTLIYNPPVASGAFLMPVLDYTPQTLNHFKTAIDLADRLLQPAHPLRLAVKLEYSHFLFDCLGDYQACLTICDDAARAAWLHIDEISGALYHDVRGLTSELSAMRKKATAEMEDKSRDGGPVVSPNQLISSAPAYPPPDRELPTPPRMAFPRPPRVSSSSALERELQVPPVPSIPTYQVHGLGITGSPEGDGGFSGTEGRSATLVGSPATYHLSPKINMDKRNGSGDRYDLAEEDLNYSRASSRSAKSARRRTEGNGSEKERKRRAVQRAEEELMRKRSENSETGTVIRSAW